MEKPDIDLRQIVESDLGPAKKQGKAWLFLCPFHQEQTGSLAVYPDGFKCFGCGAFGDAIDWYVNYHGLTFREACQRLQMPLSHAKQPLPVGEAAAEPPNPVWQAAAERLVRSSEQGLDGKTGQGALAYLRLRGLSEATIHLAHLGYNPTWRKVVIGDNPLWLAPGLAIPWYVDGVLWAIRVRCRVGDFARHLGIDADRSHGRELDKYLCLSGSHLRGALYSTGPLDRPLLVSEGELDALTAQQECTWLSAVTLGSASNRLTRQWRDRLAGRRALLVGDNDPAGQGLVARLLVELPTAEWVKLPQDVKDLNDLHRSGAPGAVQQLLQPYQDARTECGTSGALMR